MLRCPRFLAPGLLLALSSSALAQDAAAAPAATVNPADSAWMIVATALVLVMTPALALFYGGMVHRKNVLNTMLLSFAMMGLVSVLWVLIGYSLAFGKSTNGFIGNLEYAFAQNVSVKTPYGTQTIPAALFMLFQMKFAIITPALISGAIVERVKFGTYLFFMAIWSVVVYAPIACWVWNGDGWLFKLGALDFAGGTVVHLASGVSALALCIALGARKNKEVPPHNVTLTLLGAGLLWFGWFGFNAGSSLAINDIAVNAFLVTHLAAATGMLGWMGAEYLKNKRSTSLGAACGLVAGLVAITPASGYVDAKASLLIGLIAGVACYYAIQLKHKLGYDDALDVVGVHGVGGLLGALLTGVFASTAVNPAVEASLKDGRMGLIIKQVIGIGAVGGYALVLTFVLAKLLHATVGLRVAEGHEADGLDSALHGEIGYSIDQAPDDDYAVVSMGEPETSVR